MCVISQVRRRDEYQSQRDSADLDSGQGGSIGLDLLNKREAK